MGRHWWRDWFVSNSPVERWWKNHFRAGYNIELMHKYFPISSFDAVYLIDLWVPVLAGRFSIQRAYYRCEPLLEVARKRFAKRGWNNVHILCQDASEFSLPEWSNGNDPKGSVGFVTMSYSLSMVRLIPLRYANDTFMETLHLFRSPAFTHC